MNSLCLFLNTKIERTGFLSAVGDLGLAPVRYLFSGETVRTAYDRNLSVHHVASFHPDGERNVCQTWHSRPVNRLHKCPVHPKKVLETRPFTSSSTSFIKTILAVVFVVPGLFLSLFKLAGYLYIENRQAHDQVKRHFMPSLRCLNIHCQGVSTLEDYIMANAIRF